MTQPITQERIAEIEAIIVDEAEVNGDVRWSVARELLDALTASLAEAQRLRDELARRDAVRVEVPGPESCDNCTNKYGCDIAQHYELCGNYERARLVPAPPQADAVVVPRREWEAAQAFAAKWFTGCDESAVRAESDAWCMERPSILRTSAQDHNDNETRG